MMGKAPWKLNNTVSPFISQVTGGLVPRHEWLAFYRSSSYSAGGFSDAHRDLPDAGASSFINGMPQYVTVWVALSNATPETSCLYFLPACDDPAYLDPTPKRALVPDALLPCIVCEPAEPGDIFVFSHRVVHWGSKPKPGAEPRTTLTWTMTNPAFLHTYADLMYDTPPEATRWTLICATGIALNDREKLTSAQWAEYIAEFNANKHLLSKQFAVDVENKITNYRLLRTPRHGQTKVVPRLDCQVSFSEEHIEGAVSWLEQM
jgi:hypothetical protein